MCPTRPKEKEMTSLVRSISIAGGILLLAGVQKASAQIIDPVEFTTSFPFTVGNSTVPAGRYTLRPDDDNAGIFELTGAKTSVLFQTREAQANETPSKTEVVFRRFGNGFVLKDIWVEGSNSGAETLAAEGERHAAKNGSKGEQRVAGRKKSVAASNR
jgi:hypothetical protein